VYQLEVKRWLVTHRFSPRKGWRVNVHVDPMERGRHTPKEARAKAAEAALVGMGVSIGRHHEFGRADVVAEHADHGVFIVEVEGTSARQKEQALYSALGQLVLRMQQGRKHRHHFVLAVPDEPAWETQVRKVPNHVRSTLTLSCVLVSEAGVREAEIITNRRWLPRE
jgi:hypothetical protein